MKSVLKLLAFSLVILAFIFIPVIVYGVSLVQQKNERIASSRQIFAAAITPTPTQAPQIDQESKLADIVNYNFADEDKDYAIVIKNLKTGEEYRFNENKKFNSASLYKLWVLAVVSKKIKEGLIDEDQSIVGNLNKMNDILSTDPSPTPGQEIKEDLNEEPKGISMTVRNAMDKMIIYSDNYAALLLTQKVGPPAIASFLKEYGLKGSAFGSPPKTTAHDVALYYEKLYNGEIVDKETSSKMVDLLKKQAINDRLPKYLPDSIDVAHKTGELYGVKHDAGIVFGEKGDYIIVVMSDTKDPKTAAERTAAFSKQIYNYFEVIN